MVRPPMINGTTVAFCGIDRKRCTIDCRHAIADRQAHGHCARGDGDGPRCGIPFDRTADCLDDRPYRQKCPAGDDDGSGAIGIDRRGVPFTVISGCRW